MNSVQKSLVAFDTDHIKEYVFGTDRLKEIRGASSLLDRLNRCEMKAIADDPHIGAERIYANGGSGLFVVDTEHADEFGRRVQQVYREKSQGTASVTYAIQELRDGIPSNISELKDLDLHQELELLKYRLIEKKRSTLPALALPSHPFIRHCNSCGVEYAEEEYHNTGEDDTFFCLSCREKQREDAKVKQHIPRIVTRVLNKEHVTKDYVWNRILYNLAKVDYCLSSHPKLDRPDDLNEFRRFADSKEYIGLIYADANNMGNAFSNLRKLSEREKFAVDVDKAIHRAMALAIKQYLPIVEIKRKNEVGEDEQIPVFPFDILLVGGDDIVMVTDAAKAMDVSVTIAQEFRKLTGHRFSLSIGVVLAPIKYPFGLLQDMAESALKFAKKAAADDRVKAKKPEEFDGSRINFLVVTGGSKPDFKAVYKDLYHRIDEDKDLEFHASLRPYTPENLKILLNTIRAGHKQNLGRTKLHQLREAVLDKNLVTSVQQSLAALRSWREKQRAHVVGQVYEFGGRYQMPRSDPRDPIAGFPRVTFPWFFDGKNKGRDVYRTSLLDFIELYDFVAREGGSNDDEA